MPNNNHPRQKAFSLLELILTMAIIAVLGVAAAPFYSRFVLQNETANTADQLASTLRKAQSYSMAGKADSDWLVNVVSGRIQLVRASDSTVYDTYSVNSNVTIAGYAPITFSRPLGLPSTTPTATITSGSNSRTVSINPQGIVNN